MIDAELAGFLILEASKVLAVLCLGAHAFLGMGNPLQFDGGLLKRAGSP